MHVKIFVVTTIAALWNLAFTVFAPLSIARQRDFEFKETTAFDASSAQVPITGLRSSPIFPAPPSPDSSSPSPPPQSPTTAAAAVDTYPTHFVLPKFVTGPYPLSLYPEDRPVFGTIIEGLTLATKHSSLGNNNAGVYDVESFDSSFSDLFPPNIAAQNIDPSRLLVKVLKGIDDDMIAEVKALKIVGQFVASGKMNLQVGTARKTKKGKKIDEVMFELKPIIVMLKMPGKALTSVPEFIVADIETKRQMMGDTLKMMCDRVSELALEHHFVHRDNIIANILVISEGTEILDINVIDWGGKYLSSIKDSTTWDDLMGWCHHRWAIPVWERGI